MVKRAARGGKIAPRVPSIVAKLAISTTCLVVSSIGINRPESLVLSTISHLGKTDELSC
jgi:hypothetical protein